MTASKFSPIYDAFPLTAEQREAYLKAACLHFDLPYELGLLSLIPSDTGDGARRLVLYCLKGGADLLRGKRMISVTDLTSVFGDGSIVFTAKGKEEHTGRTEMASGAAYIKNLTGKALEDAIATAQTRAIRRMTLQFVGGGILDESEVGRQATTSVASAVSLAQLSQTPKINSAPGKDVTPVPTQVNDAVPMQVFDAGGPPNIHQNPPKEGASLQTIAQTPNKVEEVCQLKIEEADNIPCDEPKKRRRRRTKAEMDAFRAQPNAVDASRPANEFPTGFPLHEVPSALNSVGVANPNVEEGAGSNGTLESPPLIEKVSVEAAKPVVADAPLSSAAAVTTDAGALRSVAPFPSTEQTILETKWDNNITINENSEGRIEIIPVATLPTTEQLSEFRTRLAHYKQNVLEPAGLVASEGISIHEKIKRYAKSLFPQVADLKLLTVDNWNSLFANIESGVQAGAAQYVQHINTTIGVKE